MSGAIDEDGAEEESETTDFEAFGAPVAPAGQSKPGSLDIVYELDGLGAAKYLIELNLYVTSVLVLFGLASLDLVVVELFGTEI